MIYERAIDVEKTKRRERAMDKEKPRQVERATKVEKTIVFERLIKKRGSKPPLISKTILGDEK